MNINHTAETEVQLHHLILGAIAPLLLLAFAFANAEPLPHNEQFHAAPPSRDYENMSDADLETHACENLCQSPFVSDDFLRTAFCKQCR